MKKSTLVAMCCPLAGMAGAYAAETGRQPAVAVSAQEDSTFVYTADGAPALVRRDSSAISLYMGHGSRFKLGSASYSGNEEWLEPMVKQRSKRYLSSAEFEQKVGRAVGSLTVGMLREKGATAGSQQTQLMALSARSTTTFTSASAGYALTPETRFMATASYGKTEGLGGGDSLIAQMTSVRTAAYSAGVSTINVLNTQDRLGLTFAIPAKVRSASEIGNPGRLIGAILPDGRQINLRPTATERDVELSYSTLFGKSGRVGKVTGAVMWRVNPGHDASAPPDWLMGVRYSKGF
ncbi:hypothetical protein ACLB1G_21580 [Oxalobacteraceae bacterium A2-2]